MTDLDAESRRILELAREARTPSAEDKARVEQRFAVALGLSATAASGTAATSTAAHAANSATLAKSATSMAGLKWWIGGALVAGAVASYIGFSTQSAAVQGASKSSGAVAAPALAVATPLAAAPAATPSVPDEAAQAVPEPSALAAPQTTQPSPVQHTAHRVEPRRPAAGGDALAAELELLHRAQAAWRAREAESALALLNEHRAHYPHSQLQLERDALEVLTLCELGRKDDATRVARSVLSRAPRSPLRASLEQSCAFK